MEILQALEQRIYTLIENIKKLKLENEHLIQENKELYKKIEELELSVLNGKEQITSEKVLTKEVVDELIKNIDSLVSNEDLP